MSNTLLISATKLEHHEDDIHGIPIHIVGVGKVESAINTTLLIQKYNPDIVINFGSCGSLSNYKVGEVLEVGEVYNDFETYGLMESKSIKLQDKGVKCFTTDTFYNHRVKHPARYTKMIQECDIVDMELYSIAKSCEIANKSLYCYKWVSDDGSSQDWKANAALGYKNFKKIIYERYRK